jgi:hypothetical protein
MHNINTRNNHYPQVRLSVYQKGAHYTGIKLFNRLPDSIKQLSHTPKQFQTALKDFLNVHLCILWTNILNTRWIKSWHCWYNKYKLIDLPWNLLQSHFRNPAEFYRIWIVTLWVSSNVTEKENDNYVFHFWTGFFCTDYDNDFKFVYITFRKLYLSFSEPNDFLVVWSFLCTRFVIRRICMWLSSVLWAVYTFTFFDMFYIQWHCLAKGIYGINKLWLWL